MAAAPATSAMVVGKRGSSRLPSHSTATLPRPKAMATRSGSGPPCSTCGIVRPVKPSSAGSCEMAISTAAPCVKPMSTGELTSRSSQPKRPAPSTIWMVPDISVSHTAMATHSSLPATASGASEAPTSRLVSAVGPTDSRCDELNITAISAGNSAAYTPVTSGMPASAA
jgi:hypothetical protein